MNYCETKDFTAFSLQKGSKMTEITKDYVEEYLNLIEMSESMESDIKKKAGKVLVWYVENIEEAFTNTSNISFDYIDKDYIYYEQYFCGEADIYKIPIEFLTTSDEDLSEVAEKYLREKEIEKELQKKIKIQEERRKKEEIEEEERKLYLELKKKYEKRINLLCELR